MGSTVQVSACAPWKRGVASAVFCVDTLGIVFARIVAATSTDMGKALQRLHRSRMRLCHFGAQCRTHVAGSRIWGAQRIGISSQLWTKIWPWCGTQRCACVLLPRGGAAGAALGCAGDNVLCLSGLFTGAGVVQSRQAVCWC